MSKRDEFIVWWNWQQDVDEVVSKTYTAHNENDRTYMYFFKLSSPDQKLHPRYHGVTYPLPLLPGTIELAIASGQG